MSQGNGQAGGCLVSQLAHGTQRRRRSRVLLLRAFGSSDDETEHFVTSSKVAAHDRRQANGSVIGRSQHETRWCSLGSGRGVTAPKGKSSKRRFSFGPFRNGSTCGKTSAQSRAYRLSTAAWYWASKHRKPGRGRVAIASWPPQVVIELRRTETTRWRSFSGRWSSAATRLRQT